MAQKNEANANKFTFVWRKSVERYSDKLIEKSNQLYDELLGKEIIPTIEQEKSKTDPGCDVYAYEGRLHENGQLRAGYNVQIATEGQYALAYGVLPNPTDTRTLIPFLDSIEAHFFELPEHIVVDAGYGSEQNYEDIIENRNRKPLITYNQYRKEKKKKHKDNAFDVDNWEYNEDEDTFLCPNERKVRFSHHSKRTDKYGFTREFKVYECEDCSDCPLRDLCTKAKEGNNRKLYINEKWESQKEYVRTKLSDEKTGEIYGKRKIGVEPAFGSLKANLGFTRFSVRGKQKVNEE